MHSSKFWERTDHAPYEREIIEIAPEALVWRTLDDAFVILDEAQIRPLCRWRCFDTTVLIQDDWWDISQIDLPKNSKIRSHWCDREIEKYQKIDLFIYLQKMLSAIL